MTTAGRARIPHHGWGDSFSGSLPWRISRKEGACASSSFRSCSKIFFMLLSLFILPPSFLNLGLQPALAPGIVGSRGTDRNIHNRGRFLQGQVMVENQLKDLPLLPGKALENLQYLRPLFSLKNPVFIPLSPRGGTEEEILELFQSQA